MVNKLRVAAAVLVILSRRKKNKKRIWMKHWLKVYNFNSNWERVYAEWMLSEPARFQTLTR